MIIQQKNKKSLSKRASFIILSWNNYSLIKDCLESLEDKISLQDEIIVVDNASNDRSIELIKVNFPWVKLIQCRENLGFSGGNNVGATFAQGEYLIFLNNDVRILTPNFLPGILEPFFSDVVGVVGALVLDNEDNNIIQEAELKVDPFGFPWNPWGGRLKDSYKDYSTKDSFYVSGVCLAIKKNLFDELGGFDEDYFAYAEDLDLCWRARLRGYQVVVCPSVAIFHKGGSSFGGGMIKKKDKYSLSPKRRFLAERNTLTTLIKNYRTITLLFILPLYLFMNVVEMVFFVLIGKPRVAYLYVQVWWYNLTNLRRIWLKRQKVQTTRIVDDLDLCANRYIGVGKLVSLLKVGLPT